MNDKHEWLTRKCTWNKTMHSKSASRMIIFLKYIYKVGPTPIAWWRYLYTYTYNMLVLHLLHNEDIIYIYIQFVHEYCWGLRILRKKVESFQKLNHDPNVFSPLYVTYRKPSSSLCSEYIEDKRAAAKSRIKLVIPLS